MRKILLSLFFIFISVWIANASYAPQQKDFDISAMITSKIEAHIAKKWPSLKQRYVDYLTKVKLRYSDERILFIISQVLSDVSWSNDINDSSWKLVARKCIVDNWQWQKTYANSMFSSCFAVACNKWYHKESNICVSDTEPKACLVWDLPWQKLWTWSDWSECLLVTDVRFSRNEKDLQTASANPGTQDVTFLAWTITTKTPVKFEDIKLGYSINWSNLASWIADMIEVLYLEIGNSTFAWYPENKKEAIFNWSTIVDWIVPVKLHAKLKLNYYWSIKFDPINLSAFGKKNFVNSWSIVYNSSWSIESISLTIVPSTLNVSRIDWLSDMLINPTTSSQQIYAARFYSTKDSFVLKNIKINTSTSSDSMYSTWVVTLSLYINWNLKWKMPLDKLWTNFDNIDSQVNTSQVSDIVIKADFNNAKQWDKFVVSWLDFTAASWLTYPVIPASKSWTWATFTIIQIPTIIK